MASINVGSTRKTSRVDVNDTNNNPDNHQNSLKDNLKKVYVGQSTLSSNDIKQNAPDNAYKKDKQNSSDVILSTNNSNHHNPFLKDVNRLNTRLQDLILKKCVYADLQSEQSKPITVDRLKGLGTKVQGRLYSQLWKTKQTYKKINSKSKKKQAAKKQEINDIIEALKHHGVFNKSNKDYIVNVHTKSTLVEKLTFGDDVSKKEQLKKETNNEEKDNDKAEKNSKEQTKSISNLRNKQLMESKENTTNTENMETKAYRG